ncbi:MAG: cupredoxin domain-containing protein [Acidobacteria bacterium]|nr:cupredoxin domain-containing protein [Acidobacteriota bacterium]
MSTRLFIAGLFALLLCLPLSVSAQAPVAGPLKDVKEFDLTASRFTFTPNRIVVSQGDTVRIRIHSADIKHGFAIEAFSVKQVVPTGGQPVTVEFVASQPGTFKFSCSEYCGTGHEGMGGELVVQAASGGQAAAPAEIDEDERINLAQPDFTIVNLPTTLRLPNHKGAFRVTHRFSRPLGAGDFSDLVSDAFGFDSGSRIALELRFGLMRGTQAGVYRSNDKTIQFFGLQEIARQRDANGGSLPIGLAAFLSIEGQKNFHENYSPAIGLVVSRTIGTRGALYAEPMFVGNTNLRPDSTGEDNNTVIVGLGARIRMSEHVYLVGEVSPRVAGFRPKFRVTQVTPPPFEPSFVPPGAKPGHPLASFGIERRVGGHMFQINFSNRPWGSPAQIARGGFDTNDWFIGFNISRKFY